MQYLDYHQHHGQTNKEHLKELPERRIFSVAIIMVAQSLTPQQASLVSILENLSHYVAAIIVVLAAIIALVINRRKNTRSS